MTLTSGHSRRGTAHCDLLWGTGSGWRRACAGMGLQSSAARPAARQADPPSPECRLLLVRATPYRMPTPARAMPSQYFRSTLPAKRRTSAPTGANSGSRSRAAATCSWVACEPPRESWSLHSFRGWRDKKSGQVSRGVAGAAGAESVVIAGGFDTEGSRQHQMIAGPIPWSTSCAARPPQRSSVLTPDAYGSNTIVVTRDLKQYKVTAVTIEPSPRRVDGSDPAAKPARRHRLTARLNSERVLARVTLIDRIARILGAPTLPLATYASPGRLWKYWLANRRTGRQGRSWHEPRQDGFGRSPASRGIPQVPPAFGS